MLIGAPFPGNLNRWLKVCAFSYCGYFLPLSSAQYSWSPGEAAYTKSQKMSLSRIQSHPSSLPATSTISPLQITSAGWAISFMLFMSGRVSLFLRCWKSVKATKFHLPLLPAVTKEKTLDSKPSETILYMYFVSGSRPESSAMQT